MGICLSNRSKSDQGDSSVPPIRLVPLVTPTLKCFKLTDLRKATRNFKTDSQLGKTVYKGWIDNQSFKPSRPRAGVAVCVKRQRGFDDEAKWMDHNPKLYGFRRRPNYDPNCRRVLSSYIDPVYGATGFGTLPQCDVYSYGLVLLEVVLGRRVELRERAEWRKCIQLNQLMDTSVEGK
ncbi:putative serine/threonine-protein kinase PBL11 [Bidens hawaiensis]|uniref:putative serine/threonine-protein kinase PBL11 n=1 Tax=Bidens hawaiensis TaxID=980011 RepID=UPI004049325D